MPPRALPLHAGPREAVGAALGALGRWFDLDGVVIGGGTALEARWHHRRSTDLDLFAPVPCLDALMKAPRDVVEQALRADAGLELAAPTAIGTTQLQFVMRGVPVSLSGTHGFWLDDHDPCIESSTGTPLAPSADILLRKMQGRALAQGLAVPRDAYDFVVARAVDPTAFRDAVAQLDKHETDAIAQTFRALAGTSPEAEARGLENIAYPTVLDHGLWPLAAALFAQPEQDIDIGARATGGRHAAG